MIPFTMPCSAVTLSLATITAVVAVALLAIAFSTDNWQYIEVKRAQIQVSTEHCNWSLLGCMASNRCLSLVSSRPLQSSSSQVRSGFAAKKE